MLLRMITVCESTFSLGHGDPDRSLCGVYNMLLDSVGANGTNHHYCYIRCWMTSVINLMMRYGVFIINLFSSLTLAVSQSLPER